MRDTSTSFLVSSEEIEGALILVVEDDPHFVRILRKRLEMNDFRVEVARDGVEGLEMAADLQPELIISDWMMPRMDGLTMIEEIRKISRLRTTYVILFSNKSETDEKVQGFERGADDYLGKDCQIDELIARIRAGLRIRALQRRLQEQASVDGLTRLYNRRFFYDRLSEELKRSGRYNHAVTVTMIDLDEFKAINDTYGHLAGDAAICHAAELVRRNCRETDVVCRYGGDEFAILFINADAEHANRVMTRITDELAAQPLEYDGKRLPFGMSHGSASTTLSNPIKPDFLVHEADSALYEMKRRRHGTPATS